MCVGLRTPVPERCQDVQESGLQVHLIANDPEHREGNLQSIPGRGLI